ncbi:hypothetical protein E0H75_40190 [Kribbella capetownensis]|uniref:Uncharacterized protein n=1 Tax=Kribbella capetownensis TaxID=1572659 RepID=A0A4R0J013_9ACTN|nr:hypothetical protein [Kribbella capetownensis]TCC37386.1 hypothetical protein E0H75_40190 [Kribbella capetownensis]
MTFVGFLIIGWLVISPPASGSATATCDSVLGAEAYRIHGEVTKTAIETCAAGQTKRSGWAALLAVPVAVLASAAMTKGSPSAG